MGNENSTLHNSSPLVVNLDGKSAIISRHTQYEDAVAAVKAIRTFKESLSDRDIYFTAYLPNIGEEEFELSEDAWRKVLDSIITLNVHVVGQDGKIPRYTPPHLRTK
ncbi:hypothetical protein BDZ89DRAFT_1061354 [Hymenopellis radicata]|nr:hypothetical protein BDZ89DRAFT_1061354 [Hymenopellis radicata]